MNGDNFSVTKMSRYIYKQIKVLCSDSRCFTTSQLRMAVEYLRSIPDAKGNFIVAETSVRAGRFKLRAMAALRLEQIAGHTPSDVWQLFDADVDRQIDSLGKFKATV